MRDRLIELLLKCDKENDVLSCYHERPKRIQAAEIIADHLLANGVIVPPVKVGQTVWVIYAQPHEAITEQKVSQIKISEMAIQFIFSSGSVFTVWNYNWDAWNKYVFLTREEAEQALKGGGEG